MSDAASGGEKSIFLRAIELTSAEARAAYIDSACEGNPALRAEVDALLLAHDRPLGLLDAPEAAAPTADLGPITEGPGTVIGPYRLLEQVGEGGMGLVFMAEQARPVRRRVALKLIKPGMDTRQVIARFEAERQALAMMDHPNIARVLDAGATHGRRPYFVMELVRGLPITEYCDRHRLPIDERLGLFVHVCRAVQHAHQKGIIHRDLKPTNVLIALHDGVPVPKVIDFGIAKATGQTLTDKTLFTGFAQLVGTPLYMSPEQAELSGIDIDTRSDIYSLGVLLYELLTGTTPFDRDTLRKAALDEVRRIVREQEPPPPSSRLSALGATQTAVSANRGTDPRKLDRSLRGELDWITMKALEKDRRRRYETAGSLAADVERYRTDQPVEAGPPSAWYRVRKHARRNRVAMATAALVALALIAGMAASLWQAGVARREADRAVRAEAEAFTQRDRARKAVDEMYTQVAEKWLAQRPQLEPIQRDFLLKALAFYQDFTHDRATTPSERLDVVRAHQRVGTIESKLGHDGEAERSFRRAIGLLGAVPGDMPIVAESRAALADIYDGLSRVLTDSGRHSDAEAAIRRAIEIRESLPAEAPGLSDNRASLAKLYTKLGRVLYGTGGRPQAERAFQRANELAEALVGAFPDVPQHRACLADSLMNLALLAASKDQGTESQRLYHRAAEIRRTLVAQFPTSAEYREALAGAYSREATAFFGASNLVEAERAHLRALAIQETLAAEYPRLPAYLNELASTYNELGGLMRRMDRLEEMERYYRRALEPARRLAADFPDRPQYHRLLGGALNNVATILMLREGRTRVALRSENDPRKIAATWKGLLRDVEEIGALLEEGVEHLRVALRANPRNPTERSWLAGTLANLAGVRAQLGDTTGALRLAGEAVEIDESKLRTIHEIAWLFATDTMQPDFDEARALARFCTRATPADGACWNTLGVAEYRAGAWDEAIRALSKSMELTSGGSPVDWLFLAMAYRRKGDEVEARRWYDKAVAQMDRNRSKNEDLIRLHAEADALLRPGDRDAMMPNGLAAFTH